MKPCAVMVTRQRGLVPSRTMEVMERAVSRSGVPADATVVEIWIERDRLVRRRDRLVRPPRYSWPAAAAQLHGRLVSATGFAEPVQCAHRHLGWTVHAR